MAGDRGGDGDQHGECGENLQGGIGVTADEEARLKALVERIRRNPRVGHVDWDKERRKRRRAHNIPRHGGAVGGAARGDSL